jgi:hypothetical protein
LSITLILALGLRVWGINFGFPYAYHFDEPTYVRIALDLGAGRVPRRVNPTGFPTLLFVEYWVYFLGGRAVGVFESLAEVQRAWQADPSAWHLLFGRLTSAFLGTLNVWVVYRLGKALRGRVWGGLAALFLGVAFIHVRASHHAVPGVTTTLMVSLATLFGVWAVRRSNPRWMYAAGVAGGYAVVTKWNTGLILLPLALAAYYVVRSERARTGRTFAFLLLPVTLSFFLLGLALGGFAMALQPSAYVEYAMREWRAGRQGGFWFWQLDTVPGWLFYAKKLNNGLGSLMGVLALVGLVRRGLAAVRTGERTGWLILAFPLPYFAAMASTRHYFARYALPLVPFCALLAADGVALLWALRAPWVSRGWRVLVVMVVVGAVAWPLALSVRHDVLLTRQDTRTLAKAWIEEHVPPGAKIATDWPVFGPPLSGERYDVKEIWDVGLSAHPLDWYREEGFDYIVTTSFIYEIPLLDPDLERRRVQFYAALERELPLVQRFNPSRGVDEPPFVVNEQYGPAIALWQRERPGPVLKIYRVE